MSKAQEFADWLELKGADVEVEQEDDGNGYTVFSVETHGHLGFDPGSTFQITVNE
jgi:hypothetical protein